jgi:hypothetical protein
MCVFSSAFHASMTRSAGSCARVYAWLADFTIRPRRRPRWAGSTIVTRCRA